MKFQQTITTAREDGTGLTSAVLTFEASTWEAAGRTGDRLQRDLGMDGPSYSSIIVYAPKSMAPAPLADLLAEDAERDAFTAENGGTRVLRSGEGHH